MGESDPYGRYAQPDDERYLPPEGVEIIPWWLAQRRETLEKISKALVDKDVDRARSMLAVLGYGLWEEEDVWKVIFALRTALYPSRSGGIASGTER